MIKNIGFENVLGDELHLSETTAALEDIDTYDHISIGEGRGTLAARASNSYRQSNEDPQAGSQRSNIERDRRAVHSNSIRLIAALVVAATSADSAFTRREPGDCLRSVFAALLPELAQEAVACWSENFDHRFKLFGEPRLIEDDDK